LSAPIATEKEDCDAFFQLRKFCQKNKIFTLSA